VQPEIFVTGVGVTSAIGQGKDAFASRLLDGAHAFRVMQRPGRQKDSAYLGAEIASLTLPADIPAQVSRTASFSTQVALATLHEAWHDARLSDVEPARIGLLIGGSNFQQRELLQTQSAYVDRLEFLRPTYGMTFMDTDMCAACCSQFPIRGMAHTLGGASASSQLAVIQAIQAVASGQLDACVALGPLMDLSYWECQGFRSLGAMGSDRYANDPESACRPFDEDRDGFIFGESCGAVVVEKLDGNGRSEVRPYARLSGWGVAIEGNRGPEPSIEGEKRAIRAALERAECDAGEIDYVNPHGTGSGLGDRVEVDAIRACGLSGAHLNATKSLVGHGLTAAGVVEVVATVLQMRAGKLHPTRNLDKPLHSSLNWVRQTAVDHSVTNALSLSFGFGGINTALCLQRY
jgi:malonyl-ACP decarboxylase